MGLSSVIVLLISLLSSAPTAAPITTAGCADRCGNVIIPYPFGMTPDCYLDESFLIICEKSFDPPKMFLGISNITVTKIFLQGQLHILNFIAHNCGVGQNPFFPFLELPKFFINDTQNKFIAVGCDAYGLLVKGVDTFATGCMSTCDSIDDTIDGSCSGIGCCQTPIPKRLSNITLRVNLGSKDVHVFNSCSYAFVVKQDEFNFSKNLLLQDMEKLPMVLDWTIGNETCNVARKNVTRYACKQHSECYESDNGPGYRCRCLDGYQGNPYLSNGCQDVDECEDANLSKCPKNCVHAIGNYTCSCRKGFKLEYRANGEVRCVIGQPLVITLSVGFAAIGVLVMIPTGLWLYRKLIA